MFKLGFNSDSVAIISTTWQWRSVTNCWKNWS